MMQRGIIVQVLARDNASFRCDQECVDRTRTGTEMFWLSKCFPIQKKTGGPAGRITASLMVRLIGSLFLVIMALVLCFLVTLFVFYLIGLFFSKYFT